MKCPNCGADIEQNSRYCSYCNSPITVEMQRAQEQLNKSGCPKCGSTNITFRRENQGEVRGKKVKQVVHRTVGFCKDCGYTWFSDGSMNQQKSGGKMWLWVLGWIFIFPVPLTILMLRKKDMKLAVKYGIIAAGWIVYLLFGLAGRGGNTSNNTNMSTNTSDSVTVDQSKDSKKDENNDDKTELQKKLRDDIGLNYFGKVENDTSGNWRCSGYTQNDTQEKFALTYYNAFFEDDKEIHAVISFANKTTAKLSVVGNQIDVTIHKYVEGEEHDAKKMFCGDVLKQYLVNISDGSVEDISQEQSDGDDTEDSADIVLVAGKLGDYGRTITLNANTDMPDERYLYKIPAGKYKVTTTWDKMTSFGIVNDDNEIAIDPDTNYEYMPHVGDDYSLTAGEDDFNGHAEKEVIITIGEDESVWIPYTKDSIATPGSIKFLFFVQEQ